MNLLDLLLLVLAVSAVVGGYRMGLLARGASWLGLVAGIVVGLWAVPRALQLLVGGSPTLRLLIGVAVLIVTVAILSSTGQAIGLHLRHTVARGPLAVFDQAGGALAGGLSVLLVVWLLLPAAADIPGPVARQVRTSAVVAAVRGVTPPPPDTVQALRSLVDNSRFPEVFADLQPAPAAGAPPADVALAGDVVAAAAASTVNVESIGCGRAYEGSGVTLGDGLVVTNAHVVAGSVTTSVRRPDGEVLSADVVAFDPGRDLAVLAVDGLGQEPLALAPAERGADAVVIGYPGGHDQPRVAAARIEGQRQAVGLDIYGRMRVTRDLLFLAAELAQGDSGSAVVGASGAVAGIVFAISPDRPTTAYAVAMPEVEAVLAAAGTAPVSTGACI